MFLAMKFWEQVKSAKPFAILFIYLIYKKIKDKQHANRQARLYHYSNFTVNHACFI